MSSSSARPERRRIGPSFARSVVSTIVVMLLAVMIVLRPRGLIGERALVSRHLGELDPAP